MVEELLSNIIRYAFFDKNDHLINFTISMEEGTISLLLSYSGDPYNPLETNPNLQTDPASSDDGGMGLSLIRAFADSIEYKRSEKLNLLSIQKIIRSQPETE